MYLQYSFLWGFQWKRVYFFFLRTVSRLDRSILFWMSALISAVMFHWFWHGYTKAFFYFQHVFSPLCFSLYLLLFSFSSVSFLFFVLVFCSCLNCFRYFFPPLDSPRAGSRWSSYAQLLPPPPLIEHSCDADTANLQYPHPSRRYSSQPLNLLPENEGV